MMNTQSGCDNEYAQELSINMQCCRLKILATLWALVLTKNTHCGPKERKKTGRKNFM